LHIYLDPTNKTFISHYQSQDTEYRGPMIETTSSRPNGEGSTSPLSTSRWRQLQSPRCWGFL